MTYQGLGPVQSITILLVLVALAFSPRFVAWAINRDRADAEERRRARRLPVIMTGRQAAGRHLYAEAYRWNPAALHNYDNSPELRELWEAAAERKKTREPRA